VVVSLISYQYKTINKTHPTTTLHISFKIQLIIIETTINEFYTVTAEQDGPQ